MAQLPPGFRFHPTDAELVGYYLVKKVRGQQIEFDVVADVDLYKCEPWDLPYKSRIPTDDLEWFFFSPRDKKYPNGSRTNRATERGYWKATGRDRNVKLKSRVTGMKKTLVYYKGRAPNGERTDWLMHEYRLEGEPCDETNSSQDGYVLCRVFKKSALDQNFKLAKTTRVAPAPVREVENSVFTEYEFKPHVEALPLPALTAEPLSESQVVEDDDLSGEVTTAVHPDEELPKDAYTRPPVAVSPASSEFDSEWIVPYFGNNELKYPVMQGAESDLPPWDDGEVELPIITDLWDLDLPDLVLESPMICPDYDSPSVEVDYNETSFTTILRPGELESDDEDYNGTSFTTILRPGEFKSDNTPTGIIRKASSFAASPTPTSRGGKAKQRSQWIRRVRCPKNVLPEELHDSTSGQTLLPEIGVQVFEVAREESKDSNDSGENAVIVEESKTVKAPSPVESGSSKEESDIETTGGHVWAETIITSPSLLEAEAEKSPTIEHDGEKEPELSDASSNLACNAVRVVDHLPGNSLSKVSNPCYIERGVTTPTAGLLNVTLSISIQHNSAGSLTSSSKAGPVSVEAVVGSSSGNVTIRLVILSNMHPSLEDHGETHIKPAGKGFVQNLLTAPNDDVTTKIQESDDEGFGSKFSAASFILFVYILASMLPQLLRLTADAQTGAKLALSEMDDC